MKYTPPLSSDVSSQPWLLYHKNVGNFLKNANSIQKKIIPDLDSNLNYTLTGANCSIQYYGPASTDIQAIIVSLPVEVKIRSMLDLYYSDGSSIGIPLEAGSKNLTIPQNNKDLTDKQVHIQGSYLAVS